MRRRTVIIADDEAFLARMLSYNIQRIGAEVFIARDGAELCSLAEEKQPDLIITDYQMPTMDGLTACRRLKQMPATADIPVLMLTARGHRLSSEELSQTNIRLLLPKPFSVREVIARIEELLCASAPASAGPPAACDYPDLRGDADGRRLSDQLAYQLSRSYEVLNALFRMARCLNSNNDAVAVTKNVCDELAHVLPFNWVAIWFGEGDQVMPDLAGRLTASGALPCRPELLIDQARRLCCHPASQAWSRILLRGKNELASLAGAEVLAEAISRGHADVGVLLAGNKQGDDQDISSEETQLLGAAANFISVFHENMARYAEQRGQFLGTLHSLSAAIDAKDPYTCGHSDRVSRLASKIAAALGMDRETIEQYRIAGLLHDVGKIGVPESALCKQGRLTDEEFAQIKRHPEIGYRILHDIPSMEQVLPGVLHHHERWEGHGYPRGLAGEQIPLIGRCLALADTFDAMSSNRSYRKAMEREVVLAEIKRTAGSQFDPRLVDVFLGLDFADFMAS